MHINERCVLKIATLGCHNILLWDKNEWIYLKKYPDKKQTTRSGEREVLFPPA